MRSPPATHWAAILKRGHLLEDDVTVILSGSLSIQVMYMVSDHLFLRSFCLFTANTISKKSSFVLYFDNLVFTTDASLSVFVCFLITNLNR